MNLKNSYVFFTIDNYSSNKIIKEFREVISSIKLIYYKDQAIFKVSCNDYQIIRKYYPYYNIKIVSCSGPIYYEYLIKKYYLAILLLIISITIIILTSFLIVDINIQTNDKELKTIVDNALKDEGIKPFIIRKSYDEIQIIKDSIKTKNEKTIDWIEIQKKGMKYIINVERKIIKNPTKSPSYCNIYAKKDGMIKRVKTYQGVAQVGMNDYVKKGDLLISGDIILNEEKVAEVCASGVVYAEVWYKINTKIPLVYYEYQPTGKIRKNIIIETKEHEYQLFKNRLFNFDSTKKQFAELLGIKFYVRNDNEIKKIKKEDTTDEAIKRAINLAYEKVLLKLDKDEKILMQKVLQKQVIDSTINVDIFIVAEEKIGYSNSEG